MNPAEKLELIDKGSTTMRSFLFANDSPEVPKVIIANFLQTIPWMIYVACYIIDELIFQFFGRDYIEHIIALTLLVLLFSISLALIGFGAIATCLNQSRGITFVLLIVFYISFAGCSLIFTICFYHDYLDIYVIMVGGPLLVLTGLHTLWSVFVWKYQFHWIISCVLCLIAALTPAPLLVIDEKYFEGKHPNIYAEAIVAGLLILLISACWCASMKRALVIK